MKRSIALTVIGALCAAAMALVAPPPARAAVGTPEVIGPIGADVGQGKPFQYQAYDLAGLGYAEEEFFVSGTARNLDGEPAEYTTRILVYRPVDKRRFNGTMVLEWDNVTQQFGIPFVWNWLHPMVFRDGYAYAFVAAQSAEQCSATVPTGNVALRLRVYATRSSSRVGTLCDTSRCRIQATTGPSTSSPRSPTPSVVGSSATTRWLD